MPRNGSDVYSLPGGSVITNGETSDATDINTPLADIATDLNLVRPIVAGGTGASTETAARDALEISDKVLSKGAGYTALAADRSKVIRGTTAITLTLTAAATLGDGWFIRVVADGGTVTIDPDAAETIDGVATLALPDGNTATVFCDGTAFYTVGALSPDAGVDSLGSIEWTFDKGASTDLARLWGLTAGANRWALDLGDATAESGSDVGSDFAIKAYDDSGTIIGDAFKIRRDDQEIITYGTVSMSADSPIGWNVGNSIRGGTGSPEGVVTAGIGSLFLRFDGSTGTSFYVKESGSGNTGWVAK